MGNKCFKPTKGQSNTGQKESWELTHARQAAGTVDSRERPSLLISGGVLFSASATPAAGVVLCA